jgi:hypothetical protein
LVGPSTAVTPAPRARTSLFWGAEDETGITDRVGIPTGRRAKREGARARQHRLGMPWRSGLHGLAGEHRLPPLET